MEMIPSKERASRIRFRRGSSEPEPEGTTQAARGNPLTQEDEMVLVLLVPQGRTWSHQEDLQPLKPALSTSTRDQPCGWILNAEAQDLSSLNMLHITKHSRQLHFEHPLTQSTFQVLQCATATTLAAPTQRRSEDEEPSDHGSKPSSLILDLLNETLDFYHFKSRQEVSIPL